MSVSTQKAASTSQVNLQGARTMNTVLKVPPPDVFTDKRGKLWGFLTKLKLYIKFNQAKFTTEMNKGLYTVAYLKNAAFDWVDPKLHEFLKKSVRKREADKESVFDNFKKFKVELRKAFSVVDEKWAAEQWLHTLKMNQSAAKYAAEFQCIAVLTDWDDDALVSQYYWGLNETIKDEIARREHSEKLQEMIDTFINIDSWQWEWWMKKTGPYSTLRVWGKRFTSRSREDPMNLDAIEKHHEQRSQVKQGRCMSKPYKPQPWQAETRKCYNCGKPEHLARTCKKPQWKRKEVAAMNKSIVHDALSWTACYDDMCWTHMSSKDGAGWYPQKLKKKQNSYDTTGQLKGLAILEKVEIEETDTHDAQIEEDYNDSTWMYLNSDADSEDVDSWEIDMGLKKGLKYPEEQRQTMNEWLLKKRQHKLEKEVDVLTKQKEETEEVKQLVWNIKSHKIEIRLPTGYKTLKGGCWTFSGGYMSPEFLNRVKALQNLVQQEYNQYEPHLHLKRYVEKGSEEYIQLVCSKRELKWFKKLNEKNSEPQDLKKTRDAVNSKNHRLPCRD